jgi:hypothetical protein
MTDGWRCQLEFPPPPFSVISPGSLSHLSQERQRQKLRDSSQREALPFPLGHSFGKRICAVTSVLHCSLLKRGAVGINSETEVLYSVGFLCDSAMWKFQPEHKAPSAYPSLFVPLSEEINKSRSHLSPFAQFALLRHVKREGRDSDLVVSQLLYWEVKKEVEYCDKRESRPEKFAHYKRLHFIRTLEIKVFWLLMCIKVYKKLGRFSLYEFTVERQVFLAFQIATNESGIN